MEPDSASLAMQHTELHRRKTETHNLTKHQAIAHRDVWNPMSRTPTTRPYFRKIHKWNISPSTSRDPTGKIHMAHLRIPPYYIKTNPYTIYGLPYTQHDNPANQTTKVTQTSYNAQNEQITPP